MTTAQTDVTARAEANVLALSFLWTAIGISISLVVGTLGAAVAGDSLVAAGESLLTLVLLGSLAVVGLLAWRRDAMPA